MSHSIRIQEIDEEIKALYAERTRLMDGNILGWVLTRTPTRDYKHSGVRYYKDKPMYYCEDENGFGDYEYITPDNVHTIKYFEDKKLAHRIANYTQPKKTITQVPHYFPVREGWSPFESITDNSN